MKKKRISRAIVARAFRDRRATIIYSHGAFGLWGICCMIGNGAFYYDVDVNPMDSFAQYIEKTPQDVIVKKVADILNDKKSMDSAERHYFMDAFADMNTIRADEEVLIIKLPKREKYERNVVEKRKRN